MNQASLQLTCANWTRGCIVSTPHDKARCVVPADGLPVVGPRAKQAPTRFSHSQYDDAPR
jgi:hypothetical protein